MPYMNAPTLLLGEDVQLMDLWCCREQITLFRLFHKCCCNLAVQMRLSARFVVECVEDGKTTGSFLNRLPSHGAGLIIDQRQSRLEEID
jgi:hypothetical protein